jgi:hypothetical protein
MTFVDKKKVTTKPNGIKISEVFVVMIGLSSVQTPGSSKPLASFTTLVVIWSGAFKVMMTFPLLLSFSFLAEIHIVSFDRQ